MRFERKLNKFLWFVLMLMPFLFTGVYMFNQPVKVSLSVFLTDFVSLFGNGFIFEYLMQFVSLFNIDSLFVIVLVAYVNYLIILQLLKLAYKFILLIVTICSNFLDNFGGAKNE